MSNYTSAITCDQYITDYLEGVVEPEQLESIKEQWYHLPENYMCPDTNGFEI